jgi:hypothetical protein
MQVTSTIITECLPLLEAELEKLNKKAKRLGCTPLTMTKTDSYLRSQATAAGTNVVDNVVDIIIDGEPIKLNGWRFLGRIEAVPGADNLIFTVPGEKAPDEYRTCSAYRCQHCNQDRIRKYTWIVEHDDGSHRQVGSSCMDDFLSAKNPERAVAWWMGSMDKLLAYLKDLETKTPSQVHTGFHNHQPMLISALDTLIRACTVVRIRGKYEFNNEEQEGTPNIVWRSIFGYTDLYDASTQDDKDLADKIISFVIARQHTADYFKNLSIMFLGERVSPRNVRYICSSVYTYMKEQGLLGTKRGKNEFVGHVGDRLRNLELRIIYVKELASAYHENYDYMVLLQDADGRMFKWIKTSTGVPHKDDHVKLTGTVKKHETYNGTNQTVLTRCTMEVIQEEA